MRALKAHRRAVERMKYCLENKIVRGLVHMQRVGCEPCKRSHDKKVFEGSGEFYHKTVDYLSDKELRNKLCDKQSVWCERCINYRDNVCRYGREWVRRQKEKEAERYAESCAAT